MPTRDEELAVAHARIQALLEEMLALTKEVGEALLRQETDSLEDLLAARAQLMSRVDTLNAELTTVEAGADATRVAEARKHWVSMLQNIVLLDEENREKIAQAFAALREDIDGLQETRKGVSAYNTALEQHTGVLVNKKK